MAQVNAKPKRRRVVTDAGVAAGLADAERDADREDPAEPVPVPSNKKGKPTKPFSTKRPKPPADDEAPAPEAAKSGVQKPGANGGGGVIVDQESGVRLAKAELREIVARIENLEVEKKGIADDIKDVYAEAKAAGYDVKVLRKYIAQRKIDKQKREEEQAIMDLYRVAVEDDE